MKNINNGGIQNIGDSSGSNYSNITINNGSNQDDKEIKDTDHTLKEKIRDLVSSGRLKEALRLFSSLRDDKIKNQVFQLLGRLSYLQEEVIAGNLAKQEEVVQINQIRSSILILTNDI